MDKFETMSYAELNDAAGLIMGWVEDGNRWVTPNGLIIDYDPANDLNHAAEFGAAFLAAFTNVSFQITKNSASVFRAYLFTELGPAWRADDASEPRARTLATLKAWTALNG